MLIVKFESNQIVRITVGDVVVRLRLVDWYRNRVAIEAPTTVLVERFRVDESANSDSLEKMERTSGVKVGGPGMKFSEAHNKSKEETKS